MTLKAAIKRVLYAQESCARWIVKIITYCWVSLRMSKGVDEAQSSPWSP